MTEQIDLDALEALAKAATPGPWKVTDLRNMPDGNRDCIWIDVDREDTIQTVAEIDDEGDLLPIWGIDDARYLAAADPSTVLALIAELRQERERADAWKAEAKQRGKNLEIHDARASAALSRAEETIEKAIACEEHTHRIMADRNPTREDSSLTWRILTDYDKQKEGDHD